MAPVQGASCLLHGKVWGILQSSHFILHCFHSERIVSPFIVLLRLVLDFIVWFVVFNIQDGFVAFSILC